MRYLWRCISSDLAVAHYATLSIAIKRELGYILFGVQVQRSTNKRMVQLHYFIITCSYNTLYMVLSNLDRAHRSEAISIKVTS